MSTTSTTSTTTTSTASTSTIVEGTTTQHTSFQKLTTIAECQTFLQNHAGAVVYFGASWCGPCRAIKPKYCTQFPVNYPSLRFAVVDVDNDGGISDSFGVQVLPTIKLFHQKVVFKTVIGSNEAALNTACQELVQKTAS